MNQETKGKPSHYSPYVEWIVKDLSRLTHLDIEIGGQSPKSRANSLLKSPFAPTS